MLKMCVCVCGGGVGGGGVSAIGSCAKKLYYTVALGLVYEKRDYARDYHIWRTSNC